MNKRMTIGRRATLGLLGGGVAAASRPVWAQAPALEDRVVVITSFSRDVTGPFATAFQRVHPNTRVEVQNRSTTAAVAFIRESRASPPDIFWASAPDAFEVLRNANLLMRYALQAQGIPERIGAYPINDPTGHYFGFAASGYGIMYNTRYMTANRLPPPREWEDLARPVYAGHIGISAPSRSGTTHLTVETILQGYGWDRGWALMLAIGGNLVQVSDRSFGVPEAVNSGQYGLGIVIDFFGLSAKASGFPVEFVYPSVTAIVPANVGIIQGARNPRAAAAFVEFLMSPAGQEVLLLPAIQRLPVRPEVYARAPAGYPNPFQDRTLGARVTFDADKSELRYELLNSLFDRMITNRLAELNAAWRAIHAAEARLGPRAEQALAEAKRLASAVPVTEAQSLDRAIAGAFQEARPNQPVAARQAQFEEEWDAFARRNYAEAKRLAEAAR